MSDLGAILLAVALLAGNAFFVGAEFALISARRTQIEPRATSGFWPARVTLRAMRNVSLMMAGSQLGITICSLGLGAVGEPAVAHLLEPVFAGVGLPDGALHTVSFVVAMSIVVSLHMVLGEMVPKNIALAGPERAALFLGPPLYYVVGVLKPVIWLLNQLANLVLKLLRVQPQDEVTSAFTSEEVTDLIAESQREGLLEERQGKLLSGALGLEGRRITDIVIPFRQLVHIESGTTVAAVEAECVRTGFSRFPVLSSGDLVGYLHVKDLLSVPQDQRNEPFRDESIHALPEVTDKSSLREAVAIMQRQGAHLALVQSTSTGEPVGLVTLEDALEEMVGEVQDATRRV